MFCCNLKAIKKQDLFYFIKTFDLRFDGCMVFESEGCIVFGHVTLIFIHLHVRPFVIDRNFFSLNKKTQQNMYFIYFYKIYLRDGYRQVETQQHKEDNRIGNIQSLNSFMNLLRYQLCRWILRRLIINISSLRNDPILMKKHVFATICKNGKINNHSLMTVASVIK